MNITTETTLASRIRHHSNLTNSPYPEPPAHLLAATTCLYVIIFLLGIGGNFVVILVFLSCRSLRTFINFLFLNLCLADFLVLLISGPTAVLDIYVKEVWYLGGAMCKTVPFVENMVANASILSILAISIERYRVACRPLSQQGGNSSLAVRTMVIMWVIAAIVASPILFITTYKSARMLDGTSVKVCQTNLFLSWHKIYVLMSTVLFFLVPFVVLVFLYSKMCLRVLSSKKTKPEEIAQSKEISRLKKQLLLIVFTVVLAFFVCQTPYRATILWMLFDTTKSLRKLGFVGYLSLIYFTRILLYLNHAINPFLYNFVSRKFRCALASICCKKYNRRPSSEDFHEGRRMNFAVEIQNRLGNVRTFEHHHCLSPRHKHRHRQNDFLMLYENLIE